MAGGFPFGVSWPTAYDKAEAHRLMKVDGMVSLFVYFYVCVRQLEVSIKTMMLQMTTKGHAVIGQPRVVIISTGTRDPEDFVLLGVGNILERYRYKVGSS
jgi:hypothetical protein